MRGRADDGWWGVVIDAPEPVALATFYARVLGWQVVGDDPDHAVVAAPSGVAYLAVQRNADYVAPVWPPEPGRQQMMLHLDVEVVELDEAVADAVRLGARVADQQPQASVRVLLDPAGHPFCLYRDG
ncbi:glyoxalase [Cellulomonas hominis]|uniref:Catechol 2,3-dioxygenase-like lactoylglutathione lyase family enzyme n=1 Tax=Cellulomonas hominis TaxID=156981 RepID=A0A511FDI8_9CELL|nr:VOC family protein [Cellulomonas hominis]MBB5474195.1 catechol 2,3-dioxygenase-like lactoylglutathione lyase family enzyme [Cellulomonas hominis]NKY09374.1 VOC family protein [Cellulomonas hominis]GEL47242.1 glyoxalase [Cellulomonas hominis]